MKEEQYKLLEYIQILLQKGILKEGDWSGLDLCFKVSKDLGVITEEILKAKKYNNE